MYTDMRTTLAGVVTLNSDDRPAQYSAEGTSIIGRWKWMDSRHFGVGSSEAKRDYAYTITLDKDGTYTEHEGQVPRNPGDATRRPRGRKPGKPARFTGERGSLVVGSDTLRMKLPLRQYLDDLGWIRKSAAARRLAGMISGSFCIATMLGVIIALISIFS